MAAHTQAKHICYVTLNPRNKIVRQHIRAGGRAVAVEDGINGKMISIYDKGALYAAVVDAFDPATLEGQAIHNVQNAMFAAAMAYAMNVSLDNIRQGLRTFDTSFFQAPGRMNIYDKLGFKVILDYGHNPAAISAMCTLVQGLSKQEGCDKVESESASYRLRAIEEMKTSMRLHEIPRTSLISIFFGKMTEDVDETMVKYRK